MKPRGRELGLPFPGRAGAANAITDVGGVEVGTATIIIGDGALEVGHGPIRTGVTAILPRGRRGARVPCLAGSYVLNGNGEMTGLAWIEEAGELQTPITLTNTNSVGIARDATNQWLARQGFAQGMDWGLAVAAETYDGELNDINGFHVKSHHVLEALDKARAGSIEFGSVGGGTGMICYDFKGGNGSASRLVQIDGQTFTLGVFVQANFGARAQLTVLGVQIGKKIDAPLLRARDQGSVIAIIATDAPLMPHQLKRLARRVPMGLARTGAIGSHFSGDLFLAFSTANESAFSGKLRHCAFVSNDEIDPVFEAVVEATEEAVIDSMICNETMTGRDGNTSHALPVDQLLSIMRKAGRLT
jgi:D-aminopeptidase